MAYSLSSSNANSKIHTCSTECEQSYAQLKKLYDTQKEQLGDANDKTDVLTYHKKLLAEAVKEKEELKTKLESFETSSKSLNTLLNSQLSANDKAGFGHNGAKESKVSEKVASESKNETCDSKNINVEKPKAVRTSEPKTSESVCKPVVIKPKVLNDEPIIEEWHSDCDDEEIVVEPKEIKRTVKPGFKKVEPINARKETVRPWNNCMTNKHGLGFTKKVCFVCRSPNHLIKDCNFHENRMARKHVLNNEGKGSGQRVVRPVWNNTQRVNHKNFANKMTHPHPKRDFVPTTVLTRLGQVNTVRQNFPKAVETVNTARPVSTAFKRPNVNVIRPKAFYKVNTVRPKAEVNTVKASASLVWKPKQEVLAHVSKSDIASKNLIRYGYIDPLGGFKSIMAWLEQKKKKADVSSYNKILGLAIPGQMATGKESSNPFMAGSLPKTIHFYDSLQKFKDLSTAAKRFSKDASKQGRIHDAYATVTKEEKVNDDKETAQEVTKCLDTSS
ncbi:hypothetical protein Tco_0914597 [Tanacetum coccineum]